MSARTAIKALISVALTIAVFYLVFSRTDVPSFKSFVTGFPGLVVFNVTALAVIATALSIWRLKLIAQDLGYRLTVRDATAALSLGTLAGTMFFQMLGQLMARGALLSRRGMPIAASVTLTVYERAAAASVSLLLAIAGGWYVFGRVTLDFQHGGLVFLKIVTGLALALAAGGWLAWGPKALAAAPTKIDRAFLLPIARNVLISVAIQLTTMAAYIAAAHALAPAVPLLDLAAASAVVMLAAALPISLAGWGIRELSAVLALGVVGVPTEAALMVAVLIGITSLLVIGGFAVSSFWTATTAVRISGSGATAPIDYATVLAWTVPILAATAVLFQLYIPVGKGELNVNLADPLAILGGVLFLVSAVAYDRRWPAWRLSGFNAHIFMITAVFALALLHGAMVFGWTSWALTNRFVGWFVLLAYGATGALIVHRAGREGITILLKTFVAATCAVVVVDLFLITLASIGMEIPHALLWTRIAGFSQNPNALAFQILLALCASMATDLRPKLAIWVTAICLIGLWFATSRAATVALPFIVGFALYVRLLPMRRLATAIAIATFSILFMALMPTISSIIIDLTIFTKAIAGTVYLQAKYYFLWISQHAAGFPEALPVKPSWPDFSFPRLRMPSFRYSVTEQVLGIGIESSDSERIQTLSGAITIFLKNPLLGGGLGVYVANNFREFGNFLVIHSTPVWLLAETGFIGFAIIASSFVRIAAAEVRRAISGDSTAAFLTLILLAMAIVSLVHDLFYQRTFWFLFGAAMAMTPFATKTSAAAEDGMSADATSLAHHA